MYGVCERVGGSAAGGMFYACCLAVDWQCRQTRGGVHSGHESGGQEVRESLLYRKSCVDIVSIKKSSTQKNILSIIIEDDTIDFYRIFNKMVIRK